MNENDKPPPHNCEVKIRKRSYVKLMEDIKKEIISIRLVKNHGMGLLDTYMLFRILGENRTKSFLKAIFWLMGRKIYLTEHDCPCIQNCYCTGDTSIESIRGGLQI